MSAELIPFPRARMVRTRRPAPDPLFGLVTLRIGARIDADTEGFQYRGTVIRIARRHGLILYFISCDDGITRVINAPLPNHPRYEDAATLETDGAA
jgi:hypothetical protein